MAENLPLPVGIQENSLPLNVLADGTDPNDVLTWNGTTWISAPAGGGGGAPNIDGTANQVDVNIVDDVAVISLNNDIITPGSTTVSTNVLTNTFTSNKTSLYIPKSLCNFTSTYIYGTGVGAQDNNTITATSNVFDETVVGMWIVFDDGSDAGKITSYVDPTTVTVSITDVVASSNFTIYDVSMNIDSSLNFGSLTKAGVFSVLPKYPTNLLGLAYQDANIVTGLDTNFTSDIVGKRLIYEQYAPGGDLTLKEAGTITQVNSSTELVVDTTQGSSFAFYNIVYPGFNVDNTGQSIISGKAMEAEQISTSTVLSTSVDSIIDSTGGILNCTLTDGVENQVKTIKLKYILSNPVTVKCTFGSFTLTTNEPVRILRYLSGMWQIEDGVSACSPTPDSFYTTVQSGTKLIGTGAINTAQQGRSVALSASGDTLAIGAQGDNLNIGAAWIFTRSGTTWIQQAKLAGTGNISTSSQGRSCSLSADGNTLALGGLVDNSSQGATWVFFRSGTTWTQQAKLIGTGNTGAASQGVSVSLSASGDTLAVGGSGDNSNQGATWIFTRTGTTWTQQVKLVGTGNTGSARQGGSVSLSASGDTLAVGGFSDNSSIGAVWIFTRSGTIWTQQGTKLVGTGNIGTSLQGSSVALSADGNILAVTGTSDNTSQGAVWIFIRSETNWTQQAKLVGTGNTGSARQGVSCTLSADGNTLVSGGIQDNTSQGACWIFTRSGNQWTQQGTKLVGTGNIGSASQGISCSLSATGNILAVGGSGDNNSLGATWIFV